MQLSLRQKRIIELVKQHEPISGDKIADTLGLAKSTLRSDFAILTKLGVLDAKPKVGYYYTGVTTPQLLRDSLEKYTVREFMTQPLVVYPNRTIQDAIVELFMQDAGSLYVTDPDTKDLVGVVSRKDLLQGLATGQSSDIYIALIMTRMPNIITIDEDAPVIEAAKLIVRHEVDSLPVLNQEQHIVGKISKTNIVRLIVELAGEE